MDRLPSGARSFSRAALVALSFIGAAGCAIPAGAVTYSVTFNTSSIAGTAGSVDFQWNLGAIDPSLTATVSNFTGVPLSDPPTLLFGNVTGTLAPGNSLHFGASDPFNYMYQTLTFGSAIGFSLTLPDAAPPPSAGSFASAFVVSLFDAALAPALPTTSPDGAALLFSLAPGAGPVVTAFSAATVSAVPEPEIYSLTLVGLLAVAARRRSARAACRGSFLDGNTQPSPIRRWGPWRKRPSSCQPLPLRRHPPTSPLLTCPSRMASPKRRDRARCRSA